MTSLRPIAPSPETTAAVQRLHERSADYVHAVTGLPPGPADGDSFFIALPPGKGYEDKFTYGVFDAAGALVGCADVVRGWPDANTAIVGLLLLEPAARDRGVGAQALAAIEAEARGWGMRRLRIGVADSNPRAFGFWRRMGFAETGETKPLETAALRTTVRVMTKALTP